MSLHLGDLTEKFPKLCLKKKTLFRNTGLNFEETRRNSSQESVIFLITSNVNHCRTMVIMITMVTTPYSVE